MQAVAQLSRVLLVMAVAFGTALITCLSALPNAASKPELVDLYVLISRFALSGLIGAFLWYVPLVFLVRLTATAGWHRPVRWGLSAVSILGVGTIVLVLVRIVGSGNALLSVIAQRFGTTG